MDEPRPGAPFSPTAIGMATGMDVPGGAGALQKAAGLKPARREAEPKPAAAEMLDVIPGQSGAEGAAELPHENAGRARPNPRH